MKKRILSVLLCFVMVLGMMPTMAFAESSTTKAIQLGTSGIKSPDDKGNYKDPKSYIYFGNNSIKWRVLDADKTNNGKPGMFLLSEDLLAENVKSGNGQSWCDDFLTNGNNFSTTERNAMIAITKTEENKNTTYKY